MPKQNDFLLPIHSGEDPNTIDFYIKRLMNCSDALIAIKERRECFNQAHYEARNKDMLVIYMLLDTIEELIKDIRKNNSFRQTTNDGMRAIMEILPDYVADELHNKLTG